MNKRTWWKAAAVLAVCGSAVAWADAPKVEAPVWSRAAAPVPPAVSQPAPVVPASGTAPPAGLPRIDVVPAAALPPVSVPPAIPVIPAPPAIPPAADPIKPMLPSIPGLAPPAQPAKSADPVKPVPPAIPDFNLRPAPDGNSVNSNGAEARSQAKPEDRPLPPTDKVVFPIPEQKPTIPAIPTVQSKPLPAVPAPPEVPMIPAAPTSVERPMPNTTSIPTPGVDPMMLKQLSLAGVIGGALAFLPAPAAALPVPPKTLNLTVPVVADPAPKTVDEKLADLDKKVTDLIEIVKGKRDAQGFPIPTDPGLASEVKKLKNEIDDLRKQLDDMKKSTSLKPAVPDAMAGKGTVRIENDYPVEISIVVNSNSYRVAANTKLDVTVPAGEFSYQLLNSGTNLAPVKSPIKEKEVVRLRIK